MSIKYFAMGFTTYVTIAAIHGWGDPDMMMALLITTFILWFGYFWYAIMMS